jgi:cytoplasmic iron level regulating protein YaaA (DUF328/UPF0246 family)
VRILLPPSETKALGGESPALEISPIRDSLENARDEVIAAVIDLCGNREQAIKALKLGPKQLDDVERNLQIKSSPTLPAVQRYTGVLFDALKADGDVPDSSLSIQSSMFGLIPANTPIPYYRLSWDSKLVGLNLKKHWQQAHRDFFSSEEQVLDMRSKSYQQLAPVSGENCWVVEVLVEYPNGSRKPLNHFNKKAKGVFARFAAKENLSGIDQVHEIANLANQKAEVKGSLVTLVVPEGY